MDTVISLAASAVGLEPLVSVLSAIATLCRDMKDAQQACTRVHDRLADILNELRRLKQLPAQSKLAKYDELLHNYLTILQRYRAKPFVSRLLKLKSLMEELKTIHEEIDSLVVLLQLSTARLLVEWKDQWERDGQQQMQLLHALVDNSASVQREVRDMRSQVEALMTLQYELQQRHTDQTAEMMALLRKLNVQIVRVSNVEVPSIPSWFIPSNDVVFDAEAPFAQGSFGAVHHGMWNSGAAVVVKTLLVDDLTTNSGHRSAQARILSEIDIWFGLNHPNVIKMFGACHVASPSFIVCELAPHGNVAEFLCKSPQHQQRMWQLLYEAAIGLEYLHKRGVVHGDLKLNNILVGAGGEAKLADFGLSSMRSTSSTSRRASVSGRDNQQTAGALRWRAPECLKRKPKFASDVYSLGMCIIEAATGEPPFATVADDIVFQLLRVGEIPEQPDELDDDAWALVTAMTRSLPTERYKLDLVIPSLRRLARDSKDADKGVFATPPLLSGSAMPHSLASARQSSRAFSSDRNSETHTQQPAVSVASTATQSSSASSQRTSSSSSNPATTQPIVQAVKHVQLEQSRSKAMGSSLDPRTNQDQGNSVARSSAKIDATTSRLSDMSSRKSSRAADNCANASTAVTPWHKRLWKSLSKPTASSPSTLIVPPTAYKNVHSPAPASPYVSGTSTAANGDSLSRVATSSAQVSSNPTPSRGSDVTGLWTDSAIQQARIPLEDVMVGLTISIGSFGEVLQGYYNGNQVAIKRLLPARRKDVEVIKMFLKEAKLLVRLRHQRIVAFIGVAWDSLSDLCIVTEFMDGGDLRSLLRHADAYNEPTGFDSNKVKIALHIVHGLAYLHGLEPPILHRDIKSSNVQLTRDMDAKLTDFGVSRELADYTMTAGVGSSLWMAPEVMLGQRYDGKADIFSFGAVLSELDTQKLPYAHANGPGKTPELAILNMVAAGRLTVEFTDSADSDMVALGRACIAVDPAERPTANEALRRIHQIYRRYRLV